MNDLLFRSTQTQVKHQILAEYLDTWGGIILNGLRKSSSKSIYRFIYVDCFAYKGKYLGDKASSYIQHPSPDLVYGSPIIGIRSLDKLAKRASQQGIQIITNSILIEKDKIHFRDLINTLNECNFAHRCKETQIFSELKNGEIAVLNTDVKTISDDLISFTNSSLTWAFYLIDPFGPSGIPYDLVKKIVRGLRHDVMINLIYEDLLRKTGMALKKNLSQQHKQLVANWEKAYGTNIWNEGVIKALQNIKDSESLKETFEEYIPELPDDFNLIPEEDIIGYRERALVENYKKSLSSMDSSLVIKLISLQFPGKDRTMLYLFLTTHDPTGALSLNQILNKAKLSEYELRFKYKIHQRMPTGQMSFWDPAENIPKLIHEKRMPIEEIATEMFNQFRGLSPTRKEIYSQMADSPYFTKEIDNSILYLQNKSKVHFDGKLTHQTVIKFSS